MSARAEGVWQAEPRGWGKWDGCSRRRHGHHRHSRRRLLSATETADPPTTPAFGLPRRPLEERRRRWPISDLVEAGPGGLRKEQGREGYEGGEDGGGTSCD